MPAFSRAPHGITKLRRARKRRGCQAPAPPPHPIHVRTHHPSEQMRMWPISTRVNKPENDDADFLRPIDEPAGGGPTTLH